MTDNASVSVQSSILENFSNISLLKREKCTIKRMLKYTHESFIEIVLYRFQSLKFKLRKEVKSFKF